MNIIKIDDEKLRKNAEYSQIEETELHDEIKKIFGEATKVSMITGFFPENKNTIYDTYEATFNTAHNKEIPCRIYKSNSKGPILVKIPSREKMQRVLGSKRYITEMKNVKNIEQWENKEKCSLRNSFDDGSLVALVFREPYDDFKIKGEMHNIKDYNVFDDALKKLDYLAELLDLGKLKQLDYIAIKRIK